MKKLLFISLAFLLIACASPNEATPTARPALPETRPDDFKIKYDWSAGSLEEVYYYTYTITLASEQDAEIIYKAGYETEWRETFAVSDTTLNEIYARLLELDAFYQAWQQSEDIPAGGSSNRSVIFAHGIKNTIPSYVAGEKANAIYALYDEIESLVPQEIWASLEEKRNIYVEENGG